MTGAADNAFGAYGRDQLRRSYAEAWAKHSNGTLLSPLEAMLADIIALHPEYQRIVSHTESALEVEQSAVPTAENPFLHMGLHMALREQLAIDRPPGVRDLHRRLAGSARDLHDAEHVMMEALAETLWDAQRSGLAPDQERYLDRVRRRLRLAPTAPS